MDMKSMSCLTVVIEVYIIVSVNSLFRRHVTFPKSHVIRNVLEDRPVHMAVQNAMKNAGSQSATPLGIPSDLCDEACTA